MRRNAAVLSRDGTPVMSRDSWTPPGARSSPGWRTGWRSSTTDDTDAVGAKAALPRDYSYTEEPVDAWRSLRGPWIKSCTTRPAKGDTPRPSPLTRRGPLGNLDAWHLLDDRPLVTYDVVKGADGASFTTVTMGGKMVKVVSPTEAGTAPKPKPDGPPSAFASLVKVFSPTKVNMTNAQHIAAMTSTTPRTPPPNTKLRNTSCCASWPLCLASWIVGAGTVNQADSR